MASDVKGRCEMLVWWAGYDESHNQWVRRSVLEEDVPVSRTLEGSLEANNLSRAGCTPRRRSAL